MSIGKPKSMPTWLSFSSACYRVCADSSRSPHHAPTLLVVSLALSLLVHSHPLRPPSPLMVQFSLLVMFSLLLFLPALESSRCFWLYFPSEPQLKTLSSGIPWSSHVLISFTSKFILAMVFYHSHRNPKTRGECGVGFSLRYSSAGRPTHRHC